MCKEEETNLISKNKEIKVLRMLFNNNMTIKKKKKI
jgi:hypothetical protein